MRLDLHTLVGERLGIKVVRGVEFSTTNEGRGQHLPGYNIDQSPPAIAAAQAALAEAEAEVDLAAAGGDVVADHLDALVAATAAIINTREPA